MALTKPYFNTIPAFDASAQKVIYLNVLGGQAVTTYGYRIYAQSTGSVVASGTINVANDETSDSIRVFPITLSADTLTNNTSYYIIGYTQTSTISSPYSTPEYFTCYTTPTLSGTITNATNNIINNSTANLSISFSTNALNSIAAFNNLDVVAYGISREDSSRKIIYQMNNVYDIDSVLNITGFIPNCTDASGTDDPTSLYSSYSIVVTGYTKDLMEIGFTLSNLKCYYTQIESPSILTVQNLPKVGQILVQCNINEVNTASYSNISYVEVQRKEQGLDEWVVLQTVQKSGGLMFDFYDPFCKNEKVYNYRVVPYSSTGAAGTAYTAEVLSRFCDAFICDATTSFKITAEYGLGNNAFNQSNTMQVPYGAVFPFVGYNATTQYTSGNTSCVLLANVSPTTSALDRLGQVNIVNNFNKWMTNRRMKVLKDFNGNFWLIAVVNSISNSYYQVLGNGLASLSFDWVEVGTFTQEYLSSLDLYNNFYVANQRTLPSSWSDYKWTLNYSFINGTKVWKNGTNIFYSSSGQQFALNQTTNIWEVVAWEGISTSDGNNLDGTHIWTDGTNTYYSVGTTHYVLNGRTWSAKTWTGLTNFDGKYVWSDGTTTYYSNGDTQYELSGSNWVTKTWNGYAQMDGQYIWKDGSTIYYSSSSFQLVLDTSTSTWSSVTWTGITYPGTSVNYFFQGRNVWEGLDGNIYLNEYLTYQGEVFSFNFKLTRGTTTWVEYQWTGLPSFQGVSVWDNGVTNIYSLVSAQPKSYSLNSATGTTSIIEILSEFSSYNGNNVWDDGTNIYYSLGNTQYILDVSRKIWSKKTWIGLTSFAGNAVWKDSNGNIYYNSGSSYSYKLNLQTSTWSAKVWTGTSDIYGNYIWHDGDNVYYSYGLNQYKLDEEQSNWTSVSWSGLTSTETANLAGTDIWSDGTNIYWLIENYSYVLTRGTTTWTAKTWIWGDEYTGQRGQNIWKYRNLIYLSMGEHSYILNNDASTWVPITLNISIPSGHFVWNTPSWDVYYGNLNPAASKKLNT